jgi:hypothetical protein
MFNAKWKPLILLAITALLTVACGGPKGSTAKPASTTSGSTGPGGTLSAGESFYKNTVSPLFTNRCILCHNEPRLGGTAPITIYTYSTMKSFLTTGAGTATSNNLINRMQGLIAHTGSNQCLGGIAATPCKEVVEWYQKEFPGAPSAAGFSGGIDTVTELGVVYGWAQNVNNPAAIITVLLYANGPVGAGTPIGSIAANQVGPGGLGTGHYFAFDLPAAYKNGASHTLHAYATTAVAANLLPLSPKTFVAYTPRAAGMTYYTNTLKPLLVNRCASCHSPIDLEYTSKYLDLINPTPAAGGTSLNNTLINKSVGGDGHGGGNICGNKNNSPCAQMQQWWLLEFN